jgi:uncharacterized membrane protein YeaQ/YmgE (transglycosylase-associated protein family)
MYFAALMLHPAAWVLAGLLAGFLSGKMMRGSGDRIFGDLVLGLDGALVGGFIAALIIPGAASFWGTVLVAFLVACGLVAVVRAIPHTHQTA